MRRLLHHLADERGTAFLPAVLVLLMMMVLSGAAFGVSQQLEGNVTRTSEAQRAFAAAEAGLDRALARLNSYQPAPADCITDIVQPPVSGNWCAAAPTESLGRGTSFTYRVSATNSPVAACGGVTLAGAVVGDRCVVATGTSGQVTRRVAARLAISTTAAPFSTNVSVAGYKQVRIKKRAIVNSNITTNGKLQVETTGVLNGTATLGPKAKVKGFAGTINRLTAPVVPTLPDFSVWDPATSTKRDSATWNDNLSALAPFSTNPKVVYDGTKRELTIGDGVTLTLPPGVYNFCKLTLGKNSRVVVVPPAVGATVPKDAVRLFLDSRDRAGSRCAGNGGLDSKTGSSFVNTSTWIDPGGAKLPDPTTLQIFAWSKKTKLKVGNAVGFSGIIYAPKSKVKFNGKGKLTGGVAGDSVEIRKEMQVQWATKLNNWPLPTSGISQVVSWRQCSATAGAQPHDGCPTT